MEKRPVKLVSTLVIVMISLLLGSPIFAEKIEFPDPPPSNFKFTDPKAKEKSSSGDYFKEIQNKYQVLHEKFYSGKIDEDELAKLINSEITPLIPNREYEIALHISEQKARLGK
ncbi:hypothetical protein [Priestia koreensis]|uniref:Uncharacterized protein n=1 Tax=Priestia koreensis TaxID=284581 RepID=A0A0M0KW89_9BACI|nr:hypothetical protein [Priestia koreensis]KOO43079.1 hypothetical protein AMD01_16145 [Priestia koreensis]